MRKVIIPLAAALIFPAYAAKAQAVIVKRSVCRAVMVAPRVVIAPRSVVTVRPVIVRPVPVVLPPARIVFRKTVIYK
jgi:hypothetical protein